VRALLGRHLQISPPLVVDAADVATIAATIASALDHVAGALDGAAALKAS
jgi:adenosylmethionine-8-amino-7-oxononanoate aminotransferase